MSRSAEHQATVGSRIEHRITGAQDQSIEWRSVNQISRETNAVLDWITTLSLRIHKIRNFQSNALLVLQLSLLCTQSRHSLAFESTTRLGTNSAFDRFHVSSLALTALDCLRLYDTLIDEQSRAALIQCSVRAQVIGTEPIIIHQNHVMSFDRTLLGSGSSSRPLLLSVTLSSRASSPSNEDSEDREDPLELRQRSLKLFHLNRSAFDCLQSCQCSFWQLFPTVWSCASVHGLHSDHAVYLPSSISSVQRER